jgi:hypothetical protein
MCSRTYKVQIIQSLQSKTLLSAPWYAISQTLHTALGKPSVKYETRRLAMTHHNHFFRNGNEPFTRIIDKIMGSKKL